MAVIMVNGQPCALPQATAEAARLLSRAKSPVIAGLASDAAGIRQAVRLAARLGASVDHLAAEHALRNFSAMRDAGWMIASPAELRRRADLIVLLGPQIHDAWPGLAGFLADAGQRPAIVCIGCGAFARQLSDVGLTVERHNVSADALPGLIAALRARHASRPIGAAGLSARAIDAIVARMKSARFGVAIWSALGLDTLEIEMLSGLIKDLNAKTRFSGLPLPGPANVAGSAQTLGWLTGFPARVGFGRGYAEHDPWRFDAERMIDAGEADAMLWLSSFRDEPPPDANGIPTVALVARGTRFKKPPRVAIEVATPGIDHDAVVFLPQTGVLGPVKAARASDLPRASDVLAMIDAVLPKRGAAA